MNQPSDEPPPIPVTSISPPALSYASKGGDPSPPFETGLMVILMLLAAVLTVVSLVVVPRFETMFRDMRVDIPAITRLVIAAAHNFGWASMWVAAIALPLLIQGRLRNIPVDRRPRLRRRMWMIIVPGAIVLSLFIVAALFWPMVALIQAISGK